MKLMQSNWLLPIIALSTIIGSLSCKKQNKDVTPNPEQITASEFRLDPRNKLCKNAQGEFGYNEGQLGECGLIRDQDLSGVDLTQKNLRGIQLINVNLSKANLSHSDLFLAKFDSVKLDDANLSKAFVVASFSNTSLKNAKLQGARFLTFANGKQVIADFKNVQLTGAEYDGTTELPSDLTTLSKAGLRFVTNDVSSPQGLITELNNIPTEIHIEMSGAQALNDEENLLLQQDLLALTKINVQSPSRWFSKIFTPTPQQGILSYLLARVKAFESYRGDTSKDTNNEKITVIARNSSSLYFLNDLYRHNKYKTLIRTAVRINGQKLGYANPRTGLITLDKGYLNLGTTQTRRLATLIHEARHSDCPRDQIPDSNELSRLFEHGESFTHSQCSYLHRKCPEGHPLANLNACDDHFWGSYVFGAIFFEELYKNCQDCDEFEKQLRLVFLADLKSRVIGWDELQSGKLGEPDLSSVGNDYEFTP